MAPACVPLNPKKSLPSRTVEPLLGEATPPSRTVARWEEVDENGWARRIGDDGDMIKAFQIAAYVPSVVLAALLTWDTWLDDLIPQRRALAMAALLPGVVILSVIGWQLSCVS